MPDRPLTGEVRQRGSDFDLYEDGRRVGMIRSRGDYYELYRGASKVGELHPHGDHFDVYSGTVKTGEIRKHGASYHVYEGGSFVRELQPSGRFGVKYDVSDVPFERGDEWIDQAALGAGKAVGWLIGTAIEALFGAVTRKRLREVPYDDDEPVF